MTRYSVSRVKFPVRFDLGLTNEQARQADALAKRENLYHVQHGKTVPHRSEAIRRAIERQFHLFFLSDNSTD